MLQILENVLKKSKHQVPIPMFALPEVNGPILVLSPHFDDDIIGCGGTLIKYRKLGKNIHVVYITNGAGGRPKDVLYEDITEIRYKEAKEALKILGIPEKNSFCLNIEDGYVGNHTSNKSLEKIILKLKPELIFTPYIIDIHHDHRGTNNLLIKALANYVEKEAGIKNIMMYEIWTPLIPNSCINITGEMDEKIQALEQHKTQLKLMRYVEMVSALNKYRAAFVHHTGFKYAEAFYKCSVEEYKELMNYTFNLDEPIL